MNKRFIAVILVLLVFAPACFAASINIIVCQEESSSEVVLPIRRISEEMESVIIETLFDDGHIVTNEKLVNAENREAGIRNGLLSARESYMDYFVVIETRYTGNSVETPNKVSLDVIENVEITIRNVRTDAEVYHMVLTPEVKAKESGTQGIVRFGKEIARKIGMESRG